MALEDDANLGADIDQEAHVAGSGASREKRRQNDDAQQEPSCWWFLSSAFPTIAGTLGPVASAFSVCALVEPWRQHLVPGEDLQSATSVPNPKWLTIVGAIQLLVGLVSNLFLLLSMAKRVRFSLALPVTIIGWYISAFCRASLSAAAARPALKAIEFPQNEIIWSQSFYYGIWAAILYFIDSSLLAVTFWGAVTGYYQTEFILSVSQRTLMLQTITLLIYFLLGAYIFSEIESWAYLDAVYWSVVTLFTVGFGDYYPTTDLGRALLIPYALTGMVTLGLVISSVRSLVLEYGRRYITSRMDNRIRHKMIRTILRSDDKTLEPIPKEVNASPTQSNKAPATEFERRKTEFALMRKIQAKSSSSRRWVAMAISTVLWLILWLVGAVVFEKAEKPYQNWSYFDAFYFCFEAWTTIGYGDLAPISNAGRSFYVFWSLLALPTLTALLSHASDTVVRIIRDATILLGNLTILPNRGRFVGSMRHIISRITFGKAFPRYQNSISPEPLISSTNIDQAFPGIMAECYEQTPRDDERGCPSAFVVDQAVSQNSGPAEPAFAPGSRCNQRDGHPTATDLHFLIISEIQVVANHLKESKPHRYTFDEWAWYLRLLGEDENNSQTHCKVKLRGKHQGPNNEKPDRGMKWSWVGNGSPLIGSQEESEWILGSLIDRLRESLLAERRRQLGTSAEVVYQEGQGLQGFYGECGVEKRR